MKLSLLELHDIMVHLGAKEIKLDDFGYCFSEDDFKCPPKRILNNAYNGNYDNVTEDYIRNDQIVKIYCFDEQSIGISKKYLIKCSRKFKIEKNFSGMIYPTFFYGSKDGIYVSSNFSLSDVAPAFNSKIKELCNRLSDYD